MKSKYSTGTLVFAVLGPRKCGQLCRVVDASAEGRQLYTLELSGLLFKGIDEAQIICAVTEEIARDMVKNGAPEIDAIDSGAVLAKLSEYVTSTELEKIFSFYPREVALLCPRCSSAQDDNGAICVSVSGSPFRIAGKDGYAAARGYRGDVVVVPFRCERGHIFEVNFNQHKGQIFITYSVPKAYD
jgi:hypothetical protein